jgi:hypothetical protein
LPYGPLREIPRCLTLMGMANIFQAGLSKIWG